MASGTIRVLIVDDHRVVRAGLRSILDEFPRLQVVGEAGAVSSALEACARLKPDVLLLDLRLPDGPGVLVCQKAKLLPHSPRVLVLTSFADPESVREAFAAGVDGYLLKDSNEEALAAAIISVAQGDTVLHPSIRSLLFTGKETAATPPPRNFSSLAPQERRALALVADGRTNKEIAEALQLSEKTVRNMMTAIMGKIGVERRSQAAVFFVRHSTASH